MAKEGAGGGSGGGGGGGAAPASLGSLRVFLSFWSEPEGAAVEDRAVRLYVRHAAGAAVPATVTLHMIDDGFVNPTALWAAQGRPAVPDAAQLRALMASSETRVVRGIALAEVNASCAAVDVRLVQNSAVVVAYG